MNYRHLYKALYVSSRITANMLAQIVDRTSVRAEWLLTGAGPMLVTAENRVDPGFELSPVIQSVFPVFDAAVVSAPVKHKKTRNRRSNFGNNAIGAAQLIHHCRITGKPACFFLGADALQYSRVRTTAHTLFSRGYFTSVALTAGCIPYEFPHEFDPSFAVRTAAVNGVGLGEGLSRWTTGSKSDTSLFGHALSTKIPITVHAELGETASHAKPGLRGAELGAAWGAASYVDHLIFTEQIRQFGAARGGVLVLLGEAARGLKLLFAAAQAVRDAVSTDGLTEFSVIQVGADSKTTKEEVKRHGGQFYFIRGTYAAAATKLLRACDDVYDGKIPHDTK